MVPKLSTSAISSESRPVNSQPRILGRIATEPSEPMSAVTDSTSMLTGGGSKPGGKSRKKFSTRTSVSNEASIDSSSEMTVVTCRQHRVVPGTVRKPTSGQSFREGQNVNSMITESSVTVTEVPGTSRPGTPFDHGVDDVGQRDVADDLGGVADQLGGVPGRVGGRQVQPHAGGLVEHLGQHVELRDPAEGAVRADQGRHRGGEREVGQVEVGAVVAGVQPALVQGHPDGGPGGAGGRSGQLGEDVGVLEHRVDGRFAGVFQVLLAGAGVGALPRQPEPVGRLPRLAAGERVRVGHPLAAEVDLAPAEAPGTVGHEAQLVERLPRTRLVGELVVDEGGGQGERHGVAAAVDAAVVDQVVGDAAGDPQVVHAPDVGARDVEDRVELDRRRLAGGGGQRGQRQAPALVLGEGPGVVTVGSTIVRKCATCITAASSPAASSRKARVDTSAIAARWPNGRR